MATAMPQREIIDFEPGKPQIVRLKYPNGREISGRGGPRVMFTTADDRIFFVDPPVAQQISEAGVKPNGLVSITRYKGPRNTTNWDVRPVADVQARPYPRISGPGENASGQAVAGASPAPAPVSQGTTSLHQPPTSLPEPEAPVITPLAAKLCSSMCALIDAMSEAKAYAVRRHIDLTNEDLRALAATAFIQEARR